MPAPEYKHLVWNRTDLTVSQGNLQVTYAQAKPPLINENFPPAGYGGEVIPPYAVMRVISNPVKYKNTICWMVSRPDDLSMSLQQVGLHFFNGPSPIPLRGYGLATNDMPAPVLIDLTVDSAVLPYGNANGPVSSNTSAPDTGWFMGIVSGSWALHPSGDLISYGANSWVAVDTGVANGIATMVATQFPYTIIGRDPVTLSGKTPGDSDSPEVAFLYSNQVFWVGRGGLGFGSTGISG